MVSPGDTLDRGLRILSRSTVKVLPEFVVSLFSKKSDAAEAPQERPKIRFSSLDGLRGIGALCVVNSHLLGSFNRTIGLPLYLPVGSTSRCGSGRVDTGWTKGLMIFRLPVANMLVQGKLWVHVFFVLSGFVLSQRPLRLARAGEWDDVLDTLSSATLRRPVRLFLPAYVTIFLSMILIQSNALMLRLPASVLNNNPLVYLNDRLPTFWAQLRNMVWSCWRLVEPYDWMQDFGPYNPPLWTITMEFRCSLPVFVVVLALCRLTSKLRLMIIALLVIDGYLRYHWDASLFLLGVMISESTLISGERRMRQEEAVDHDSIIQEDVSSKQRLSRWHLSVLWMLGFFLAIFLMSSPAFCAEAFSAYSWIKYWPIKPLYWPYEHESYFILHSVGSTLLVFLVSHASPRSWIRRYLLDTAPVQYLGRVSFSLYITHTLMAHLFGYRIFLAIWKLTGRDTVGRYLFGMVIAYSITMLGMLWLAELFCRTVDEPGVRLAHRLVERSARKKDRIVLS